VYAHKPCPKALDLYSSVLEMVGDAEKRTKT
jgi:hypothetical protein